MTGLLQPGARRYAGDAGTDNGDAGRSIAVHAEYVRALAAVQRLLSLAGVVMAHCLEVIGKLVSGKDIL